MTGGFGSRAGRTTVIVYEYLVDWIGYAVARILLPILSFGMVYVEPLDAPLGTFNAFGLRRDQSGRIEVESTIAGFIGLVLCIIAIIVFCLIVRAAVF